MSVQQIRGQSDTEFTQQEQIQGWEVYPLALQAFRSYIDDLHRLRERLEKKSSLLFIKDPHKIALELLVRSDDGKANISPMILQI